MKISVIIPTYNASMTINNLLNMISQQSVQAQEIIIIDSSSTDDTRKICRVYGAQIIVIKKEEFNHGKTRTIAAKHATGDILIYFTQDSLPLNYNTLGNIIDKFKNPKVAAAYGKQISHKNTNIFGKHLRYFNYGSESYVRKLEDKYEHGIKTAFISNSFAAYRKTCLHQIGYFKDNLIFGEDNYAGARLLMENYCIAYASDAVVIHSHSYTIFQDLKRYFDMGVFHASHNWLLAEFGNAEGTGLKYIVSEIKFLFANNAWYMLPQSIIRNMMKYFGYRLGIEFRRIPYSIIFRITMNKVWWIKTYSSKSQPLLGNNEY
ncbi:MAG: glycosyltransferase family 2 protein [Bacteroidetes bacterium]|nr:glycosyltransferase family 2 protein [Bacteroidota bacterium]